MLVYSFHHILIKCVFENCSKMSLPSDFRYDCTAEVLTNGKVKLSKYKSLNSGMTICIAKVNGPMVRGFFAFGTEAFDDDGLPHTLEHLVFLGSEKYPYKGVLDMIAGRCLSMGTNAWTDIDHTCYTVTTAGDEGFLNILPIYLDHILFPTLTDAAFTTEVHHINSEGEDAGIVYCEMQGRENTGLSLCYRAMFRALYPGHCGYKSETGGLMKNLRENTTNERVRQYHKDFYRPENLCVIIVGQVEADKVFEALIPVEERILQEDKRSEFVRPWQSPVPPLPESVTLEIEYPTDEEEYGMVLAAWRGPLANNHLNVIAIQILMSYFTANSAAPLNRDFVEIEDPLCNGVYFSFMDAAVTMICLFFSSVPVKRLNGIKEKLLNFFRNIVDGKEAIDMQLIATGIKKRKLSILSSMESYPSCDIVFPLIGDFLYGSTLDDLKNRVNEIPLIEELFEKDAQFWIDLLKTYIVENNHVIVSGTPSSELSDKMSKAEKERVKKQQEELGPEGLKEKAEILKSAIEANKVPPPKEMLTAITIPSVKSIKFHPIKRICNVLESEDVVEYSMDKMPCRFQVDDIQTNFVRVLVMIDTSDLPLESRMYLPILVELLYESAVERDGILVPYQDIVKQLAEDTISISATLGWDYWRFFCSSYAHIARLFFMVEEEKYEKSVEWIRENLHQIYIDSSRIKCIANKMISDVPFIKQDGRSVVASMMKNLCFRPDSTHWTASAFRQNKFLIKLLKDLETNSEVVVSKLNEIRDSILKPEKMVVHLAVNLENLKKKVEPEEVWIKKFLTPSISPAVMKSCFKKCSEYLLPMTGNGIKGLIAGLGSVESSYLMQTAACTLTRTHPDYAKLLVLIKYLTNMEGPMWRQIRGSGYAYSCNISLSVTTGLIYFNLSKSTHLVKAYKEAVDIVDSHLNGTTKWDLELLESARSSLMCSFIRDIETIADVVSESVLAYCCNSSMDITKECKELLEKISMVTTTDMESVGIQYLKPLFNPELSWCAITCNPTKVKDISEEFEKLSRELTVVTSLDDSFLSDY